MSKAKHLSISTTLQDDPMMARLNEILGLGAFYYLTNLYTAACIWQPSGVLTGLDEEDIEIVARWTGGDDREGHLNKPGLFAQALKDCGWLEGVEGDYQLNQTLICIGDRPTTQ